MRNFLKVVAVLAISIPLGIFLGLLPSLLRTPRAAAANHFIGTPPAQFRTRFAYIQFKPLGKGRLEAEGAYQIGQPSPRDETHMVRLRVWETDENYAPKTKVFDQELLRGVIQAGDQSQEFPFRYLVKKLKPGLYRAAVSQHRPAFNAQGQEIVGIAGAESVRYVQVY